MAGGRDGSHKRTLQAEAVAWPGLQSKKEPFKTQEGGWVGEADPLGIWEVTRIQTLRGCRVWVKNLGLDPKKNRKQ